MSFENIFKGLEPFAVAKISLSRDVSDVYKEDIFFFTENKIKISPRLVISSGSNWQNLIGWNSYFGKIVDDGKKSFYAFGLETAEKHPTSGSFLTNTTYIVEYPFSPDVVNYLSNNLEKREYLEENIVLSESKTYGEHLSCEKQILEKAIIKLTNNCICNFRTLLVCDENVYDFYKSKQEAIFGYNEIFLSSFSEESVRMLKKLKKNVLRKLKNLLLRFIALVRKILTLKTYSYGRII